MDQNHFEFRECSNPHCFLRIPVNPHQNKGEYCPLCGSNMRLVATTYTPTSIINSSIQETRLSVSCLLDNIRSELNVGSIFRTADGAGLSHLYLCGITPDPQKNPKLSKTSLGSEDYVTWSYHPNAINLAATLKAQNYRLLALECTPDALPIEEYQYLHNNASQDIIVIGSETAGIDPGLLALCDLVYAIPMRGFKESLNVSVAFGIAAYWMTKSIKN